MSTKLENDADAGEDEVSSDEDTNLLFEDNIGRPPMCTTNDTEDHIKNISQLEKVSEIAVATMDYLNVPLYEDVTVMINSSIPFLIDGDALIMYSFLQNNHEVSFGGQSLHVNYFCERFLNTLLEKGGNFIIVFFNIWENFWDKTAFIKYLRLSVYTHLKMHTNYSILQFQSFFHEDFLKFIDIEKPRCVLLDIGYHLSIKDFCTRVSSPSELPCTNLAILINCAEILFFRTNQLPCIDVCEINIDVSTICSYNLHSSSNSGMISLAAVLCKEIIPHTSSTVHTKSTIQLTTEYANYDARRLLTVIASKKFLSEDGDINILKLILLSYAALEVFDLEHRCCHVVVLKKKNSYLRDNVTKWLDCVASSFEYCSRIQAELSWHNVADIWQGTIFGYICYAVQHSIIAGLELGHLQESYETYVTLVTEETGKKLDPYPITPICDSNHEIRLRDRYKEHDRVELYRLNNPLRSFCGNPSQSIKWKNPIEYFKSAEFDEVRHWHCKQPLTDEYDNIRDSLGWVKQANMDNNYQSNEKWKQKSIASYARYLTIYGHNLEGKHIKSEAVICKNNVTDRSSIKPKKERKSVLDLREKIINEKKQALLEKEEEMFAKLRTDMTKDVLNLNQKIHNIHLILAKLSMNETILKVKLLKLKVYRDNIKKLKANDIGVDAIKDILLTIKSILESTSGNDIREKDQKFLSKLLHELGFVEIAKRNNLPSIIKYEKMLNLNWVRFQLEHLGADMKRISGGSYDPDIGFTPDPWQSIFIDAIRKKKSALVVAPTSSGKTFAAYYCMKRVLEESEDGVVVYVAPTKALVNQVEATVYARFKNTKLRYGKSVVGVFTRDYKRNALNSRILVTVPQCLDIFLLSPRRYTWLKNVKYAIFDEVHKLSGSTEGVVWERCLLLIQCPFLALSATISDIPNFHKWLIDNENFKREQHRLQNRMRESYEVVLVEHTERHSDLIKYVYNIDDGLEHYHPYCALTAKTLKECDGIPATIRMSPSEVLQLFDIMSDNELTKQRLINEGDMETFFSNVCGNGFITRNEVTQYENIISTIFYEEHVLNESVSRDIIGKLTPVSRDSELDVEHDVPLVLQTLAERKMLPCIVFSYNRTTIEQANYFTTKWCKEKERASYALKCDKRLEKVNNKIAKMEKKMREKEEGSNKDQSSSRAIKTSAIVRMTGSIFKGEGVADSASGDIQFIEKRLSKTQYDPNFVGGLPYGLVYHHAGLNNILRSTAEILYRVGILKVVFATGTLALGIHMPCKSVVIYGDSVFLNNLEFHQMSGRAGRRGFDNEGNVIFMGLAKARRDALMTNKLPKMLGNFPVTVSLIARLLLLITKVTDNGKSSQEVTDVTISHVLTLLENSLLFQWKPNLKVQIRHFVEFSAQLLFKQRLYNEDGVPLKLAGIINHLHYHEPANFVFAYLFRCGALRKLVSSHKNPKDIQWALIIVLSHLFARLKLHKTKLRQSFKNSVVILEPLPKEILEAIEQYNREVEDVFNEYFLSVANDLANTLPKDDTLPVSKVKFAPLHSDDEEAPGTLSAKIKAACVKRIACSAFVALSGNDDTNLYTGELITNIKHEICPGIKVVPLLDPSVLHNSYAADFYRHGIVQAIRRDNDLKSGNEFNRLKDFLLVMKSLVICLEELEPINQKDPLYVHLKNVKDTFEQQYNKAFYN